MDALNLLLALLLIGVLLFGLVQIGLGRGRGEDDEQSTEVAGDSVAADAAEFTWRIQGDAEFEAHVRAALDALPAEFAERLSNVEILIEPRPRPEQRRAVGIKPWQTLYGLYQGIPLPARRSSYGLVAPDVITIFSEPLKRDFPTQERLRAQIRRTVLHEIAHHFGMSDEWLHEIDAY